MEYKKTTQIKEYEYETNDEGGRVKKETTTIIEEAPEPIEK